MTLLSYGQKSILSSEKLFCAQHVQEVISGSKLLNYVHYVIVPFNVTVNLRHGSDCEPY